MIGYLKGKVIASYDGTVIIECAGVGYEVLCSASIYERLVNDSEGEAYIYTAVREDGISLYGFSSLNEKQMFLKLISVSGIGPKMGITVLSSMNVAELATAIAMQDVKKLSSVKGLGKKTAERIILELKESVQGEQISLKDLNKTSAKAVFDKDCEDAITALISLGFKKSECVEAVSTAKENGADTVEKIIAYALRNM